MAKGARVFTVLNYQTKVVTYLSSNTRGQLANEFRRYVADLGMPITTDDALELVSTVWKASTVVYSDSGFFIVPGFHSILRLQHGR